MKKFTILLFLIFTLSGIQAQNYQDVVYLKNGSIIHGIILEQIPGKTIKIETADGNVFTFQMDEIEKIAKERTVSTNQAEKKAEENGFSEKNKPKKNKGNNASPFCIKAGLNSSKVHNPDADSAPDQDINLNFHLGGTVDIPISETFSFETGLFLINKGVKSSDNYGSIKSSIKISLWYLDIPFAAKLKFSSGDPIFYGTLGPYVGIGLSGKHKSNFDGEKDSEPVDWGSDESDDYKRLDYGLQVGAGIEKSGIQISVFYKLGLAQILPDPDDKGAFHRILGLSVGYKLGAKSNVN